MMNAPGARSQYERQIVQRDTLSCRDEQAFRWTDAGVGAGGMLGLIVLAGGCAALVTHRPHRRSTAAQ